MLSNWISSVFSQSLKSVSSLDKRQDEAYAIQYIIVLDA